MGRRSLTVALLAVAATGCTGPYSADGICDHATRVQCRFWYGCCSAAERLAHGPGGGTLTHSSEAECVDELHRLWCRELAPYRDGVHAGRLTWNEEAVRGCFEPVERAVETCDADAFYGGIDLLGCHGVVTGTVAQGGTCFLSAECTDAEASCRLPTSGDASAPLVTATGTCESPPGAGEACDHGGCLQGLFCDADDACQRLKQEGDGCGWHLECSSGYCAGAGLCAARQPNGAACDSDYACRSERCSDDSGLCIALQALGEGCLSASECDSGYCDYDAGRCAIAPWDAHPTVYDLCDGSSAPAPALGLLAAVDRGG